MIGTGIFLALKV